MGYSPWGRKESDTTVRLTLDPDHSLFVPSCCILWPCFSSCFAHRRASPSSPESTSWELLVLCSEAAFVSREGAGIAWQGAILLTRSVENAQLRDNVQQQENPRVGDQRDADDGVVPLGLPLELCVAPHEHGDPHHPDDDGDEHGDKDEPAMLLPVLTRAAEGGLGDKEREGHQEEDVDQEDHEVHVELIGCHVHKHATPGHDESHVLNGDDGLQQADTNSNAQNCRPREGDSTPDQLHQVGGVSQEAREAESKEDPKEKVADGGSLLIQLDDEGKSKAKEPQHTQEEEELGGEDIPVGAVLDPSHEEEKRQEQHDCNHYANCCQGLQNNAPCSPSVTEEVIVPRGLLAVLIHGDLLVCH